MVLDAAGGDAIARSVALGVPPERIGTIVDDKPAPAGSGTGKNGRLTRLPA